MIRINPLIASKSGVRFQQRLRLLISHLFHSPDPTLAHIQESDTSWIHGSCKDIFGTTIYNLFGTNISYFWI